MITNYSRILKTTSRAILFQHVSGHEIWIPRSAVTVLDANRIDVSLWKVQEVPVLKAQLEGRRMTTDEMKKGLDARLGVHGVNWKALHPKDAKELQAKMKAIERVRRSHDRMRDEVLDGGTAEERWNDI